MDQMDQKFLHRPRRKEIVFQLLPWFGVFWIWLLAVFIRIFPHIDFYPIPGSLIGFHLFEIIYIIGNSRTYSRGDFPICSQYTSGIYMGTNDLTKNKFQSLLLLITGLDQNLPFFYRFFLWSGTVVFPLSIMLFYLIVKRANPETTSRKRHAGYFVLLFSLFPSSTTIGLTNNGLSDPVLGWIFLVLTIYSLYRSKEKKGFVILSIIFSAACSFYYRTATLFLICILISWMGFVLIRKISNRIKKIKKRLFFSFHLPFTLLLVVILGLNVSAFLFGGTFLDQIYTLLISHMKPPTPIPTPVPTPITTPVTTPVTIGLRMENLSSYFLKGAPLLRVIQTIGSLLTAIPAAIFLFYYIRKRYDEIGGYEISTVIMGSFAGLGIFAITLYFWGGIYGVIWRVSEYGSILTVIALALILGRYTISKGTRRLLIGVCSISMVLAITLSTIPIYHYQWNQYLTFQEREGIDWAIKNLPEESVFFTDIRLGMHLILSQRLNVVGITDTFVIPADTVVLQLESIYYGSDQYAASTEIGKLTRGCRNTCNISDVHILLSRRMTLDDVGIRGYQYYYKPAPKDFLDKFKEGPEFSTVFHNNIIWIFKTTFSEL